MRPLRWKNRYVTGDAATDRRSKKLIGCFNQLVEAADQREHCQEMEAFITNLSKDVESCLHTGGESTRTLIAEFYPRLVAALPLVTHDTTACHQCGLCDLATAKIASHLEASLACLKTPET
ncbi:conserved hypothetical protein [Gammaproteobacteria bacterium]